MARAGRATGQIAAAPSGPASSSSATAASFAAAASSGASHVLASSSSASAHMPSGSLSSVSGAVPSGSLPSRSGELSGDSLKASGPARLRLGPLRPPPTRTHDVEASSSSASVAEAQGPARAPSVAVSLFQDGSAPLEVSSSSLPLFMLDEPGWGAGSSGGCTSRMPSPPLVYFACGAPASTRLHSCASSGPLSPSGCGMSARGGCGGARSCGRCCSRGGGCRGGSAGPLEPPLSPATLAAELRAYMEAKAPRVMLLH